MGGVDRGERLPRWWEGGGVDPWRGVVAPGLRRFATRRMKRCEPAKARKEVSGGEMDGKVGVSAYYFVDLTALFQSRTAARRVEGVFVAQEAGFVESGGADATSQGKQLWVHGARGLLQNNAS
jgi:hypothetical protein